MKKKTMTKTKDPSAAPSAIEDEEKSQEPELQVRPGYYCSLCDPEPPGKWIGATKQNALEHMAKEHEDDLENFP